MRAHSDVLLDIVLDGQDIYDLVRRGRVDEAQDVLAKYHVSDVDYLYYNKVSGNRVGTPGGGRCSCWAVACACVRRIILSLILLQECSTCSGNRYASKHPSSVLEGLGSPFFVTFEIPHCT